MTTGRINQVARETHTAIAETQFNVYWVILNGSHRVGFTWQLPWRLVRNQFAKG